MNAEILLHIAILIILAKILGEFFQKHGLSVLLGEVFAGVLLGPLILDIIYPDSLAQFALIGIVLLLFVAGFEAVDFRRLAENKKYFLYVGTTAFFIGFLIQVNIGLRFFSATTYQAIFYALIVGSTDVAVFTRTLISLKRVRDRLPQVAYSTAIADNILAFVVLGIALSLVTSPVSSLASLWTFGVRIFIIVLIFVTFASVSTRLLMRVAFMHVKEAEFTFIFGMILLLAYVTESLGSSAVLGAFFAGIVLGSSRFLESTSFTKKLSSVSYGIFIPLFFAWAGLSIDFSAFTSLAVPVFQIIALAIGVKFTISFLMGNAARLGPKNALGLAICDYSRGGEQLLMIMLARTVGVLNNPFGDALLLAVIILILLTTVTQPIFLRYYYSRLAE